VPNSVGRTPLLSVCVPTHDGRGREIADLIRALEAQITPELAGAIELCLSDGASRDQTAEVVDEARARALLAMRYRRSDPDRGLIPHLRESVEMASAPHCWLMSSDDAAAPGALQAILRALDSYPGLAGLSFSFEVTARELERKIDSPAHQLILPPDPGRSRHFDDREAAVDDLSGIFVSLSTHVVDRELWLEAVARRMAPGQPPLSPLCGHMQFLGTVLALRPQWLWLAEPLLLMRTDNDSWRPRKFGGDSSRYWRRLLAELADVYAELCGPRSRSYRDVMARWRAIGLFRQNVIDMKLQADPPPSLARDIGMLVTFTRLLAFDPDYWRKSMPVLLLPHGVAARVWDRWAKDPYG
jgi:glycosyltransferase involved in cell wall biosynthesis